MTEQTQQDDRKYQIHSIKEIDTPSGMQSDQQWYQYIISHGPSRIEGKRPGTLESVKEHVEEYTQNLNQRSNLGYSNYASRKPKQANK